MGSLGRLAQLGERQLDMLEVGGSKPSPPTILLDTPPIGENRFASARSSSWSRTPPFQGGDQGFESPPGYFAKRNAGVAQWQCASLPSWLRGFDSHRPLSRSDRP